MSTDIEHLSVPEGFDPVAYINDPDWHTSVMGLERIAELLDRLGNPQENMRIVHVAGTNGKGSTCVFTASVLQQAGFKTGMFTSPYVIEFSERIQVNGANIPADELLDVTLAVRDQAEAMAEHPTEFELMTAVAFVHFARQQCDIAVVEVGMGGRLDSTNIIKAPEVCVITPIALDHTEYLGETYAAIAGEKCGIIKQGATVVSAHQEPDAAEVVARTASDHGCELRLIDLDQLHGTPRSFSYKGYEDLSIGLLGSYQPQNAALAIEVIDALRSRGFSISDDHLRQGLAAATWPARFQLVDTNPDFIVDGGHNPQGALALASSLEQAFPDKRPVFLMGVLADKDYPAMLATFVPLARAFVCVEPPNPRKLAAKDLAQAVRQAADDAGMELEDVQEASSFADGIARARKLAGPEGLVCACGSLYSVADIMAAL